LVGRSALLAARNCPEWLACWLALLEAGAIPIALDPDEPEEAQRAVARQVGAQWRWRGGELELLDPGPSRRRRVRDCCLCKLTSGSTGAPRVLPFTHAQMIADGRQVCATMGIETGDMNFAVIPFGHSYGLGNLVLPLVLQGTPIVIGSGPLPQSIAAECQRWRPTVFPAVPALLRLLTMTDVGADALASLRLVISAGVALDPGVARTFAEKFGRPVHGFYGSSETGGICFDRTGEATAQGRSVGTPLEGVRLEFRRGRRFAVRGPAVMRDGVYAPPDRGELNAAGELVLLGRTGRVVKVAGRRLDLAEVEQALRALPGVREAWACAHPRKAEAVAAAVVGGQTAGELRTALASRVAAWKIPDRLLVLPEFPVTTRGKPDTRRLQAMF
jgi:acyl-coenzyme A synthetase/AMP-(fatty) acid ligase